MNTVGILGFQAVLKLPGLEYANDAVLQSGQVLKGLSLANPILKLRLNLKMVHREQQNSGQTV